MGKHLLNEDIVLEEGDGLGEDGVVMVAWQSVQLEMNFHRKVDIPGHQ